MALKPLQPLQPGQRSGALKVASEPLVAPAVAAVAPALHAPAKAPRVSTRWEFKRLLTAPHRLAFFSAAVMLALSALWWCALLFARAGGVAVPWAIAPSTAHGLLMALGFMPLFIGGFMFTAGPRWLEQPEVHARELLPQTVLTLVGWAVCLVGFHTSAGITGLGLLMVAGAWSSLTLKFTHLWRTSPSTDTVHATLMVMSCVLGALAMWAAVVGLAFDQPSLVRTATQAAIYGFVASVFAVVSHRMIPFFGASALPLLDAWRPMWLVWVMVVALWFEGLGACLDLWVWPNSAAFRWVQVGVEAPVAGLMLWLAVRWGLVQSLKIRLLAMLHGGFLWLGIALALQAVSHTLMALSEDQVSLGLAPLHALTMGYLGATLFAMASRVASGHSGRPLVADNTAWVLYWVLQLGVFLRVASALWPQAGNLPLLLAVSCWATAGCGWAWRYGGWLGRPRLDGRPG